MLTPWVTRLLAANVVVFVLQVAVPQLTPALWLVPAELLGRPWSAVTYMFLHGGFMHLFFNMLILFFFGPRLEVWLGVRRFLGLYVVSGLAAALVSLVFTPQARIVGASGAIFGLLLGFARYWPREKLLIYGIVPMEARWLVALAAGFSLWAGFSGAQSGVAHFAHLGGFAGGWAYLAVADRRRGAGGDGGGITEKVAGAIKRRASAGDAVERWEAVDPGALHEVNRDYWRELMERVRRDGPGDLSERERTFLDRMAERADPEEERPDART